MQTQTPPLLGHRNRVAAAIAAARALEAASERFVPPTRKALIDAAKDAAAALSLTHTQRLVLEKLTACYGETPIEGRVLVWPSNRALERATNLNERAIRRAISALIAQGLVIPKDSPRRNRFARRDRASGAIVEAYGFDLSPVWAGQARFAGTLVAREQAALELAARGREIQHLRIAIISALEATAPYDPQNLTQGVRAELSHLDQRRPRPRGPGDCSELIGEYRLLRRAADDLFHALTIAAMKQQETIGGIRISAGLPGSDDRLLEEKSEDSSERFKPIEPADHAHTQHENSQATSPAGGANKYRAAFDIPLTLILSACADSASAYGKPINTVAELVEAGRFLRPSLQASHDAWLEGERTIGDRLTGLLALYVFQIATEDMRRPTGWSKPRGYYGAVFRSLIRKTCAGTFDLHERLWTLQRRRRSRRN